MKTFLTGLIIFVLVATGALYFFAPPVNMPIAVLRGGIDADAALLARRIRLPDGFRFTVFASGLAGARMMQVTSGGDLLVTTPRDGTVHLLYRDDDGDGTADGRIALLSDLNRPHGIELYRDWLYVAEIDAVGRIRFDATTRQTTGQYERIVTGLPVEGRHWTRTVRVGPDGWLYIGIGSACNACREPDERRGTIQRASLDGRTVEPFATGLRNPVGFDWSPHDGALYATDNGRDLLGDNAPPDELNRVEQGQFYGWPAVNGFGEPDPEYMPAEDDRIDEALEPVFGFRPHNAPLGVRFLRAERYPDAFRHDALVALHGSWNRAEKDGYKVVRLHWSEDGAIRGEDFMTGFLIDGDVIGRPVDIAESPAGEIFVSDDFANAIYRIVYSGGDSGPGRATLAAEPDET